jgi:hypothetical protein
MLYLLKLPYIAFGCREFYTVIPHDFGFRKMREFETL